MKLKKFYISKLCEMQSSAKLKDWVAHSFEIKSLIQLNNLKIKNRLQKKFFILSYFSTTRLFHVSDQNLKSKAKSFDQKFSKAHNFYKVDLETLMQTNLNILSRSNIPYKCSINTRRTSASGTIVTQQVPDADSSHLSSTRFSTHFGMPNDNVDSSQGAFTHARPTAIAQLPSPLRSQHLQSPSMVSNEKVQVYRTKFLSCSCKESKLLSKIC